MPSLFSTGFVANILHMCFDFKIYVNMLYQVIFYTDIPRLFDHLLESLYAQEKRKIKEDDILADLVS